MGKVENAYPLTTLQMGMLFHTTMDGADSYHDIFTYYFNGKCQVVFIKQIFENLVQDHGVLRTIFELEKFNEPLQIVLKEKALSFEEIVVPENQTFAFQETS